MSDETIFGRFVPRPVMHEAVRVTVANAASIVADVAGAHWRMPEGHEALRAIMIRTPDGDLRCEIDGTMCLCRDVDGKMSVCSAALHESKYQPVHEDEQC